MAGPSQPPAQPLHPQGLLCLCVREKLEKETTKRVSVFARTDHILGKRLMLHTHAR